MAVAKATPNVNKIIRSFNMRKSPEIATDILVYEPHSGKCQIGQLQSSVSCFTKKLSGEQLRRRRTERICGANCGLNPAISSAAVPGLVINYRMLDRDVWK